MNPGPWGLLVIAVVVLLLFGRGKISGLMGEVAGGIKAFRKGMSEEDKAEDVPDDKPVATIDQKSGQPEPAMNKAQETERSKDV